MSRHMNAQNFVAAILVLLLAGQSAPALPRPFKAHRLTEINSKLHGRIIDVTKNHGQDCRYYSQALGTKRDMYVYVPPGYDGLKQYPIMIWLHGLIQGEESFLEIAPLFDRAIAEGKMPPVIIAAPDGTVTGRVRLTQFGTFFLNGVHGNYEDMLVNDVWAYLNANFAIRPEKEAHVLAGASMGGLSAFNLAIKHRDTFHIVAGILPPLDLLFEDSRGGHSGPFDPNNIVRKEEIRPLRVVGRLYGVIPVREGALIRPVYGNRRDIDAEMISENPADMLEIYQVKPGELQMFIAYGAKDQFNIQGETDSFLYFAGLRDLTATVVVDASGRHNKMTGRKFFDFYGEWLTPLLQPYVPQ
jgi:hypothetical protein